MCKKLGKSRKVTMVIFNFIDQPWSITRQTTMTLMAHQLKTKVLVQIHKGEIEHNQYNRYRWTVFTYCQEPTTATEMLSVPAGFQTTNNILYYLSYYK